MANKTFIVKWKNPTIGTWSAETGQSYEKWWKAVNAGVAHICGLPADCGEDVNSRDWYDDGMTVNEGIQAVLDAWGFSDDRFN